MTVTVAAIQRHPLKSHGREGLDRVALVAGQGLPWDRRWAVAHEAARIRAGEWAECANFSRGAKAPRLMAIDASLDEAARRLTLTHPDRPDISFCPDDPADAARFLDWVGPLCPPDRARPARIHTVPVRGMTDTDYPSISLVNLASSRALGERMGADLSPLRWRANFWIDGLPPFAELELAGRRFRLGTATVEIVEPIVRCLATAANPATGERDADTLGALSAHYGHRSFGVYARVVGDGAVAVGDALAELP
ncbi:MAG: MOSC domain-containing protein [Proteobacteria bacterium]|nr:MOSC domain-containing protein [Pseudomonadota bacterium]MBS0574641.1 MOSC domain-containing protein [Pseudomonadota bacterium]